MSGKIEKENIRGQKDFPSFQALNKTDKKYCRKVKEKKKNGKTGENGKNLEFGDLEVHIIKIIIAKGFEQDVLL